MTEIGSWASLVRLICVYVFICRPRGLMEVEQNVPKKYTLHYGKENETDQHDITH